MDKPLPDKDKKENRQDGYNPALTEEAFQRKKTWWDAPGGRLAIRIFSRGLMGAAFFTAGGLLNRRWMHTGEEMEIFGRREGKYDATKGFLEQKNPLQFIAKTIDTFIGKPIEFVVTTVAGKDAGKNAVRFRQTKFKDMEHSLWRKENSRGYYRGRSLGNETVAVTFDFFCMSIGDALARDIVGWFEPNVQKKWIKDGHIDFKEAAKSAAKSAFRYVTYNGGEDWAVAIPYVYFMKGQRAIINHFSPGFMYDFDRNLNGGSHKIDQHGKIVGNFNLEGALDLQSRFVTYNIGTLMFRELYRHVGNRHAGRDSSLYGDPSAPDHHKTLREKTGDVFKWMARSFVKAGIYMQFAVPFFWISRTPQTNYRGLFIHQDGHGSAMTLNYENQAVAAKVAAGILPRRKYEMLHANEALGGRTNYTIDQDVYFSRYSPKPSAYPNDQFEWVGKQFHRAADKNPLAQSAHFDAYDHAKGPLQNGFNAVGRFNQNLARATDPQSIAVENAFKKVPFLDGAARFAMSLRPNEPYSRFSQPHTYAALSYAPYFMAKTEAAALVDTPAMDVAAERMIDGATAFKWGEFKAGAGEVWRAFVHKPFTDPTRQAAVEHRQALAQKLSEEEKDGGAVWQEHIGKKELVQKPEATVATAESQRAKEMASLGWRERLVQGKPEEALELNANKRKSHAEKEELRDLLAKSTPPTNSVN
jgi:hypothetical protein